MLVYAGIAQIFAPLIDVFQSILKFFHDSGGFSWGLSIVLLTIAVRAVLVPLTFRQIKGMVRMQALQPQMKEIQQKYKQDKQRQQQEIMKFYRENKVNPLASCLPMVLQLPVFFALYYMLRDTLRRDICPKVQTAYQAHYAAVHHLSSVAKAAGQTTACGSHAHGAAFLFINDLTAKGTGVELIILILLYVGSQLGSTLVMSASSSMDPTQRKIMMFMPIVFVLFVIRFPAGLMLYWITTNLWTVTQQYVVRRYVGPTVAVAGGGADEDGGSGVASARGGPSGGGGSSGGGLAGLGGFGERMRERLERAQSDAATKRQGGARTSGSDTAAPAKSAGSAKSSGSAKSTGTKSAGTKSTATTKRPAQAKKGGGSSTNGSGSGGSTPPPRSPRKKKKRSGRRR